MSEQRRGLNNKLKALAKRYKYVELNIEKDPNPDFNAHWGVVAWQGREHERRLDKHGDAFSCYTHIGHCSGRGTTPLKALADFHRKERKRNE